MPPGSVSDILRFVLGIRYSPVAESRISSVYRPSSMSTFLIGTFGYADLASTDVDSSHKDEVCLGPVRGDKQNRARISRNCRELRSSSPMTPPGHTITPLREAEPYELSITAALSNECPGREAEAEGTRINEDNELGWLPSTNRVVAYTIGFAVI